MISLTTRDNENVQLISYSQIEALVFDAGLNIKI